MQLEIQSRHDSKVAAAATDRPEEILVPAGPEFQHVAVSGHELRTDDVVARRPEESARGRISAREQGMPAYLLSPYAAEVRR